MSEKLKKLAYDLFFESPLAALAHLLRLAAWAAFLLAYMAVVTTVVVALFWPLGIVHFAGVCGPLLGYLSFGIFLDKYRSIVDRDTVVRDRKLDEPITGAKPEE